MCIPKPKTPKLTPIPDRKASVLPDQGDPSVRLAKKRGLNSAMIFTKQGMLGAPSIASPSSTPMTGA